MPTPSKSSRYFFARILETTSREPKPQAKRDSTHDDVIQLLAIKGWLTDLARERRARKAGVS